jgi:hypothetical protein
MNILHGTAHLLLRNSLQRRKGNDTGIGILFIAIAGAFIAQEMRRVEEVKRSGTA